MPIKFSKNQILFWISTGLEPLNTLSLNTIYATALGAKTYWIYHVLYGMNQLNKSLNNKGLFNMENFLNQTNLNLDEFETICSKLEEFQLLKTWFSDQKQGIDLYKFELLKPIQLEKYCNDLKLINTIQKYLPNHVNTITANVEALTATDSNNWLYQEKNLCEISLNNDNEIIDSKIQKNDLLETDSIELKLKLKTDVITNLISKKIRNDFFGQISQAISRPFTVGENVWKLIYLYHVEENILTIDELVILAVKAMIIRKNDTHIDFDNFQSLILEKINNDNGNGVLKDLNENTLRKFWKSAFHLPIKDLIKKASFFAIVDPENLINLLTEKNPNKLVSEWIRVSKINGFKYDSINAIISFTFLWIEKIPTAYLKKLTKTIVDQYGLDFKNTMTHLKNVIISDFKNGTNRLKIKNSSNEFDLNNELNNFNQQEEKQETLSSQEIADFHASLKK